MVFYSRAVTPAKNLVFRFGLSLFYDKIEVKERMMNKYLLSVVGCLLFVPAAVAVQYGREMQQLMALQATANAMNAANITQQATGELPVRVLDRNIEAQIRAGSHATTIADLEACRMVSLTRGTMVWGVPTAGAGLVTARPTCLMEIHMVYSPEGRNLGDGHDRVLAQAFVPAGSSIRCNIDDFPPAGYLAAAGEVYFPRDTPPTEEEVERQMNREMRQGAVGRTIGAVVVGAAGAVLLRNEEDTTERTIWQAVGAGVTLGGLTYAGTQAGHVAGAGIIAGGMGAASGMVIGNVAAGLSGGGDAWLDIRDCIDDKAKKCVWGTVSIGALDFDADNGGLKPAGGSIECWINVNRRVVCATSSEADFAFAPGPDTSFGQQSGFINITVSEAIGDDADVESIGGVAWTEHFMAFRAGMACIGTPEGGTGLQKLPDATCGDANNRYVRIASAQRGGRRIGAMIEDAQGLGFGSNMKQRDWQERRRKGEGTLGGNLVVREPNGKKGQALPASEIRSFTPFTQDASDGDVLDFANRARLPGTAWGGASGAVLGASGAVSEARAEVQERHHQEVQRWQGLLRRFGCVSPADGNLPARTVATRYNDPIVVNAMR